MQTSSPAKLILVAFVATLFGLAGAASRPCRPASSATMQVSVSSTVAVSPSATHSLP